MKQIFRVLVHHLDHRAARNGIIVNVVRLCTIRMDARSSNTCETKKQNKVDQVFSRTADRYDSPTRIAVAIKRTMVSNHRRPALCPVFRRTAMVIFVYVLFFSFCRLSSSLISNSSFAHGSTWRALRWLQSGGQP